MTRGAAEHGGSARDDTPGAAASPVVRPADRPAATPRPAPAAPRGWADGRNLLYLGSLFLLLVLVALLAAATTPDPDHYGWLSLLPAAIAIVLAFATRNVILALFLGIATGGIVFAFGSGVPVWSTEFPWGGLNIVETLFLAQLGTRDWALILFVYLWCLGGLIGLWTRTGGAVRFAEWAAGHMVRGPRTAKLFAWVAGVIFHQGGTISVLIAGTTVRSVLDEHKVSKEEAAFLIDSTASPMATLIPFNAFPLVVAAAVVGTIDMFPDTDAGRQAAVAFFFQAIPFNFYAIFAVLFALLLGLHLIPAVMGMGRARARVAATGALARPGSEPLTAEELTELKIPSDYRVGLADFLLPLGTLLVVAIVPFMIQRAVGAESPTLRLAEAFFLALMAAVLVALVKGMPPRAVLDGIVRGAKGVTLAAIILALAITIKGVSDALGTGLFVADLLGDFPMFLLPTLLLLAAMLVAFSTGTSFGTFAVLFPVAVPLAWAVGGGDVTFLAMCFGAVVGGSVFGDKASPISDTTILSSLAVGCDVMDHVTTQLPYAILAAGLAAVLYVVLGLVFFG